ncbi:MAG: class I SAM-dependent methyltransferase [Paracoccaceae bacterium]
MPISPYLAPNFYADALAKGRHRDIVGGRWDETGRAQMALLLQAGLQPHHTLLDIGCGSLRLGCKAVSYLDPGNYWGTDLSAELMAQGHQTELADPTRLNPDHLIQDDNFAFPNVPPTIDYAIAFAVFTHLPLTQLRHALGQIHARFPTLQHLLFTVFLGPDTPSHRQPDGVVTHATRAPYHFAAAEVLDLAQATGFTAQLHTTRLPRGQILCTARRAG